MGLECAPILAIGAYTDCVVATGVTEEHVVVVDVVVTVTVPVVDMLSKVKHYYSLVIVYSQQY